MTVKGERYLRVTRNTRTSGQAKQSRSWTNSQITQTSTVDTRPRQMVHLDYKGTNQRSKQAPTWDSHTCTKSVTNGRMTSRPKWVKCRYSSKTNGPLGLQRYKPKEQTGSHVGQSHVHKVGHKWPDDLEAKMGEVVRTKKRQFIYTH
ncbi:hypothetical protein CSKR_105957 [Clonorchis sinensis]|uniref:Uncharacterized protein n=1 Tax=Clonorchis sinensis TaxID=79923 RepID=A0A3R7JSD8_CLOSI|nr:hypothetical protein CSKR_105957 [Clonorchis sinensis]